MANPLRCAIYTRKSTEDGLEQAFNSLDAQREACGAYILSQAGEGWSASSDHYDDGGISGGTMARPALMRLLAEIEAGRIQIIVVYKVDRLTRSLADFAKIVEILDRCKASFVSVTQAFNTTTSMGRLTLNVLLSFAQFEREVTGERIRDKIAASKRKGMWMGGPVPLGYDICDKKLIINDIEAATVRHIFERYLAHGSLVDAAEALAADGIIGKHRTMSSGKAVGGQPFHRGGLAHLLRNPLYIGKVRHREAVFDGEHDGLLELALWDAVQARLDANLAAPRVKRHTRHRSLLAGIAFDGLGRKLSPSHAVARGKRFRYYITHRDTVSDNQPQWRLPAHDLEHVVATALGAWLDQADAAAAELRPDLDASDYVAIARSARQLAATVRDGEPDTRSEAVRTLIERVDVGDDAVGLTIPWAAIVEAGHSLAEATTVIAVPATRVRRGDDIRLIIGGADPNANRDQRLIDLMVEARLAHEHLSASTALSLDELAEEHGHSRKHFSRLLRLATLAPDIVGAILDGRQPAHLSRIALLAAPDVPMAWNEQRVAFGFA
jgi:site-specific DNA recombinase